MTERKVLNRYYPVDYDPSKIPKLKRDQKEKNKLWGIRVMAPFNMRCNTCGEYIYKGKKFNSKKETVEEEDYLGIQLHRFYIRCPRCVAVIAFRTDPENCDYICEAGATRNFEAAKTLMDMEKKKQKEAEEEELNNPMKVLENRTKQSRNEMETIEALTELREMRKGQEKVDHAGIIHKMAIFEKELERLQDEEDERIVRGIFGESSAAVTEDLIKRLSDNSGSSDEDGPPKTNIEKPSNPTDYLTIEKSQNKTPAVKKRPATSKSMLAGLVKVKKTSENTSDMKTSETAKSSKSLNNKSPEDSANSSSTVSANANTNSTVAANGGGALGLLGGYDLSSSDSECN